MPWSRQDQAAAPSTSLSTDELFLDTMRLLAILSICQRFGTKSSGTCSRIFYVARLMRCTHTFPCSYEYRTADAFVKDFELMKNNAVKFNGKLASVSINGNSSLNFVNILILVSCLLNRERHANRRRRGGHLRGSEGAVRSKSD